MHPQDTLEFACQRSMIRRVPTHPARFDLLCAGRVRPDGLAIEACHRHQARRVLIGIKARAGRIAVRINYVAMKVCPHRCGTWQDIRIKPVDVPVCVGERLADRREPREHILRNKCTAMGNSKDDRSLPLFYVNGVHGVTASTLSGSPAARESTAPFTRAHARSRSGAMKRSVSRGMIF